MLASNADGHAPVALFVADHVVSSPSGSFTVSCTLPDSATDAVNLFALEYSDLAPSGVDATGDAHSNSSSPLTCASLTTTAANDLVVSLYNNWTSDSPAGIAATSGYSIPDCYGGDGGACAAQDGNIYEVGAMATRVAATTGTYTPGFYGPSDDTNEPVSCAAAALKVIGP